MFILRRRPTIDNNTYHCVGITLAFCHFSAVIMTNLTIPLATRNLCIFKHYTHTLYTHIYTQIYTNTYTYKTHTHMYTHTTHTQKHTHTQICMHAHTRMHAHTHTQTRTHAHTHTHTHTYLQVSVDDSLLVTIFNTFQYLLHTHTGATQNGCG